MKFTIKQIETSRLKLRHWKDSDQKPFAELNRDPEVMEYFPDILTEAESNLMIQRITAKFDENGWGFWAAELKDTHDFIGFVGLNSPTANLPFTPCVEIGWRLSRKHWGNGYATEAAQAVLKFAFENISVTEIVSFTPLQNIRSQSVMQKIGMTNTGQNFIHPSVPVGDKLQEHVLFKITKAQWQD